MKGFNGRLWSQMFLSLLSIFMGICEGGKILVVPMEGSHWVNMDILVEALHAKGHSLTVLRTSKSWYIKKVSPHYNAITISGDEGFDSEFFATILTKFISKGREESSILKFASWKKCDGCDTFVDFHRMACKVASNMFKNKELMTSLNATKYDMVLTDPGFGNGIMLAHYLQIPLVYNARWTTSGEAHFVIAPSPLSYVPLTGSRLTDKMVFSERLKNMIFYFFWHLNFEFLFRHQYQAVCDEFLGADVYFNDLLQGADLWLMNVDFVLEFPRPTMPNVVYVGGFQCKPPKPLPRHLEDFVQSSGEHGVIVMSLGTFISKLQTDLTEIIAHAFAGLPQKVIWRYIGDKPGTLGNNTLLVDWIPQNDLLGHPKLRLFVTHGGINGVQEAMYHGVPVLGLPLLFDQYDNLLRLKEKGAAKMLSLDTMDKEDNFLKALQEVLHEPSYKTNMQRLSRLHRDQPIKSLDRALFWIEYVMRHKGAAHLRAESYRMPWYSYHSVDVIMFLLAAVFLILLSIYFFTKCLCARTFCKQKLKCE